MTTARWSRLIDQSPQLQRSSHCVSVANGQVYVFGGELRPREPRDNDLFLIDVSADRNANVQTSSVTGASPSPRVGSALTTLDGRLYLFSGRGGPAMAPIDEHGGMWEYNPSTSTWTLLPTASASFPPARSYHCTANDNHGIVYVHAGCPEKGRLSDLWAFHVKDRTWKQLADAPPPQRGGTSIAFVQGKLYRMNGFDGKTEQGGNLDVYDPEKDAWSTITYPADGKSGPSARSVAALLSVTVGGQDSLVTLFGEADPSSLGHQGAGKMLGDVWIMDIAKSTWKQVSTTGDVPPPRGWFDADVATVGGEAKVVVAGGLADSNERLGDVWVLTF
ncbi:hypothetical protein MBLNU457_4052t2 [Dothideomycetes sp. NU457]